MNFWDGVAASGEADANMCHVSVEDCLARLAPIFQLSPTYVLDLGCGVGRLTQPVAQRLKKSYQSKKLPMVDGIDSSAEMIRIARERLTLPNVTYRHNDGLTLPEGYDMPLDAAFSIGMFQHIPDDVMSYYISQVMSRLRQDGVFVFQFVEYGEEGPLSYIRTSADVADWITDYSLIKVNQDKENAWAWMTVIR